MADLDYKDRHVAAGPLCPARDPANGRIRVEFHGEGKPGALLWLEPGEAWHLARQLEKLKQSMRGEVYPVEVW